MKKLILILGGIWVSWHYSDIYADNILYSIVAPLGLVLFSAALAGWLVWKLRIRGGSDDGSLGGFDDGGGGD